MRSFEQRGTKHHNEQVRHAVGDESKERVVTSFSESERVEIEKKRKILSSLAYFIGKDFEIPVELNEPGAGWHWDFQENKIRIDPNDLLLERFNEKRQKAGQRELNAEEHFNHLRFVISHEGGHRRMSRTGFIPLEEWQQPGFSFMMNAIEDPRDNNFVADNYPKFKEQMAFAYEADSDVEHASKEKAKKALGYHPRFMQAGFEYIKQWYRERTGSEFKISESLPEEVKEVVRKTLQSAQDSWWRYPSRQEADDKDSGEENITKYAKVSYEINRDEIWPEFQKLVEKDMEDQKMQEFMKDAQSSSSEDRQEEDGGESGGQGLPHEMKDKLTPQEQKEWEEAIERALENGEIDESGEGKGGAPIDMDSLSDELKQKIKEHIDSLPEEKKKELEEKARETLGEFGEEIADDIGGKLSDNPAKAEYRKAGGEESMDEKGEEYTPGEMSDMPEKIDWHARERQARSETDKQKVREALNQAQFIPHTESRRKGAERNEHTAQDIEKEVGIEKTRIKGPEIKWSKIAKPKLEGSITEQIQTAVEILGEKNVFGPTEVMWTWGVAPSEVPPIPFSAEELNNAEKLGQKLFLRVDKTSSGEAMSVKAMNNILMERWRTDAKRTEMGKLLYSPKKWERDLGADRFSNETPRPGWALVGGNDDFLLAGSTNRDYIEQTEVIMSALLDNVFKGVKFPDEYAEAIFEFHSRKGKLLEMCIFNLEKCSEQLSELKITELTRQTAPEVVYDVAMCYERYAECLLEGHRTCTASPNSDNTQMIFVGMSPGRDGVLCGNMRAGDATSINGVSLSRRL